MRKSIFQKLLALSIIGVFASANVFAATVTLTGKFMVEGNLMVAELKAERITVGPADESGNSVVTATPPFRLTTPDGKLIAGSDITSYVGVYNEDGKGGSGSNNSKGKFLSATPTNDGLSITSDDALDVEIYDLSGSIVYSATGINNLSIDGNTLNLANGTYMLRSVKEGREERVTLLFDGNSFTTGRYRITLDSKIKPR